MKKFYVFFGLGKFITVFATCEYAVRAAFPKADAIKEAD